jgi:hypothetical protein
MGTAKISPGDQTATELAAFEASQTGAEIISTIGKSTWKKLGCQNLTYLPSFAGHQLLRN